MLKGLADWKIRSRPIPFDCTTTPRIGEVKVLLEAAKESMRL